MRNPRRSYDKDGRELQPATVGSERAEGRYLAEIWCHSCARHVEVPTNDLPPALAIPDICLRYRCSKCGGKRLTSRRSILEFYAQLTAERKRPDG
jgi:ribosomal protein L44E